MLACSANEFSKLVKACGDTWYSKKHCCEKALLHDSSAANHNIRQRNELNWPVLLVSKNKPKKTAPVKPMM